MNMKNVIWLIIPLEMSRIVLILNVIIRNLIKDLKKKATAKSKKDCLKYFKPL